MDHSFAALIPVFNGERHLRTALESVLQQTRPLDEIIVIDDGSTDATPDLLRSFGDRVRVVRQANGGVAAARNVGFRAARSRWVALLDADDYWHPQKIAVVESAVRKLPDAGFFYSDAWQVDEGGARQRILRSSALGRATAQTLLLRSCFVTSSAVVQRDRAVSAGLFREDFLCKAGMEDWDFFIRLANESPGFPVPGRWTYYRHHSSSAIQSHRDRLRQDAERVVDLNSALVSPRVARRARALVYFESGVRHMAALALPAARRELVHSFRGAPNLALKAAFLWVLSWGGAFPVGVLLKTRRWVYGIMAWIESVLKRDGGWGGSRE